MCKMLEKAQLCLFIFCVILAQEIVGSLLDEDIEESSNVLIRRKRVINRITSEDVPVDMRFTPYVINIKKNGRLHCIGTILSQSTVITAARCASDDIPISILKLVTGSIYSYSGHSHNVTEKKVHDGHYRGVTLVGIALLIANPPFVFCRNTNSIDLHTGPVLAGMHGTVSGWGTYYYGGSRETQPIYRQRLRSISVPIMNHRECVNIYQGIFPIADEYICTYHEQKQCAHTDTGAGLVIDGKLAGVHIGAIETQGRVCPIKPDVFMLLQHLQYGEWIRRNIVH